MCLFSKHDCRWKPVLCVNSPVFRITWLSSFDNKSMVRRDDDTVKDFHVMHVDGHLPDRIASLFFLKVTNPEPEHSLETVWLVVVTGEANNSRFDWSPWMRKQYQHIPGHVSLHLPLYIIVSRANIVQNIEQCRDHWSHVEETCSDIRDRKQSVSNFVSHKDIIFICILFVVVQNMILENTISRNKPKLYPSSTP